MPGKSGYTAADLLRGQPLLLAGWEMAFTGALQGRFCAPTGKRKERLTATIQYKKRRLK